MSLQKEIPYEESLQGSWVELHYNTGSGSQVCQEQISTTALDVDLEKLLLDAQHESSRSTSRGSSQCDSPLRSQTPLLLFRGSEGNSSQSEEDNQEIIREVENLLKKNADWIWDWSSRPENNPPKEFLLKHPRRSASLSIRKTSVMKKGGVLSPDFLKLFLPSLFISHILAVGLGIYIGRRLSTYSTYWSWCCIMTPLTHTAGMPSNGGNFRIQGEVVDVAFSIFIWLPLIFWMLWLLLSPRNALNQELICNALFLSLFRMLFYIELLPIGIVVSNFLKHIEFVLPLCYS